MSVAFIYSFEQSFWKSCQTITTNLIETYKLILKKNEVLHFNYNETLSDFKLLELATNIISSCPSHLVIVDHKPHIYLLLKYLEALYSKDKKSKRPEIIIHIFGDFTLYGQMWVKSESILKKYNVKFICASDAQVNLVSSFLKNKNTGVYKLPFPVNSTEFYFSSTIRTKQRNSLKIPINQTVFLYTGRMSLQKKVIELAIDFSHFLKVTNANAVLYLAGDFDDLGNPFTGIHYRNGEFCQRYLSILENIEPQFKANIRYVGNLNSKELMNYYNLADFYISLSVHNDEDYGMSPAEALCTGLPSILSDWAGYKSFNLKKANGCSLIPTKIEIEKCRIDYDRIILLKTLMISVKNLTSSQESRQKFSKINIEHFSILGNVSTLKKIINSKPKPFIGFSSLMPKLASAFSRKGPPFILSKTETITTINAEKLDKHPFQRTNSKSVTNTTRSYTSLYKKIYESYLSK